MYSLRPKRDVADFSKIELTRDRDRNENKIRIGVRTVMASTYFYYILHNLALELYVLEQFLECSSYVLKLCCLYLFISFK